MAEKTNDLDVWQYLTPVVSISTDNEFDVWQNLTPVEDIDGSTENLVTRRRVMIF